MSTLTQGTVTIQVPEGIQIPSDAGTLSTKDMQRLVKARSGVGFACQMTAQAMRQNPGRLNVPEVNPDELERMGNMAEGMDLILNDLDMLREVCRQANLIIDSDTHNMLRRVLAFVRAQQKFDNTLPTLVPQLEVYFGNE